MHGHVAGLKEYGSKEHSQPQRDLPCEFEADDQCPAGDAPRDVEQAPPADHPRVGSDDAPFMQQPIRSDSWSHRSPASQCGKHNSPFKRLVRVACSSPLSTWFLVPEGTRTLTHPLGRLGFDRLSE